MKKLTLYMDTLRVDSFGPVPSAAARDGVRAHEDTIEQSMCGLNACVAKTGTGEPAATPAVPHRASATSGRGRDEIEREG